VLELCGAEEGSGGLGPVLGGELVPVVLTDEDWFASEGGGSEAWDLLLNLEELDVVGHVEVGGGLSLGSRGEGGG